MRLLDSSLMPPPRGGFPRKPSAAEVQWWCSPQSSVPRQTVGHHARAATYEMGLNNLRRLPCGGAQCEPDDPPTGPFHIPTDRRAGRGTPLRADARAVVFRKTHSACASLKIDSRAYKTRPDWPAVNLHARGPRGGEGRGLRRKGKDDRVEPQPTQGAALQFALCFFPFPPPHSFFFLPLVYPPTDAQAGARAGGLSGGLSGSAKPILHALR